MVYHSRYLNFFERARTEWLRAQGIDQATLVEEHNLLFAIRKMDIDFRRPARMDDELEASVRRLSTGGSKMVLQQELRRSSSDELLCAAEVTAACLEADSFVPVRIPQWLRSTIGDEQ